MDRTTATRENLSLGAMADWEQEHFWTRLALAVTPVKGFKKTAASGLQKGFRHSIFKLQNFVMSFLYSEDYRKFGLELDLITTNSKSLLFM